MTIEYIIERDDKNGYISLVIYRADPKDQLLVIYIDTGQDDIDISSDWGECLVPFDMIPTLIEALGLAQQIRAEIAARPKPPESVKPPPTAEELYAERVAASEEIESYLRHARVGTDPALASNAESLPD